MSVELRYQICRASYLSKSLHFSLIPESEPCGLWRDALISMVDWANTEVKDWENKKVKKGWENEGTNKQD